MKDKFHLPGDMAAWQDWLMAKETKQSKNPAAVALGRLGGLKGGAARAKMMTAAERKASARKAARARWSKKKKKAQIVIDYA